MDELMELLRKQFDDYEMLICTRVQEAWGYGTMGQDDFSLVAEDDLVIEEFAQAILSAGYTKGE